MTTFYAQVPESMLADETLTFACHRVYQHLDLKAGKRGFWFADGGQPEIAAALHMGLRSVKRAVGLLRAGGYIKTERFGPAVSTVLLYHVVHREEQLHAHVRSAIDARSEVPQKRTSARVAPYISQRSQPQNKKGVLCGDYRDQYVLGRQVIAIVR